MDLPAEIWELIFFYVQQQNQFTSADDLINCSKTCTKFSDILESTKSTWLLKKVLPIIFPNMDRTTILTLRRVCKPWKWTIDHFLENYNYYHDTIKNSNYYCQRPLFWKRTIREDFHPLGAMQWLTSLSSVEQLERFLFPESSQFLHSFPGRSFSLSYKSPTWDNAERRDDEGHRLYFCSLASDLLQQFGERIHYLHLYIRNPIQANFIEWIVQILKLAPNLRRFRLNIYLCANLKMSSEMETMLPPLQFLNCLEFAPDHDQDYSSWIRYSTDHLQNRFTARYLPQLARVQLTLEEHFWKPQYLEWGGQFCAANLQDFELKVAFDEHFRILEMLSNSQTQLKTLTLHLDVAVTRDMEIQLGSVLNCVLPFSNSLEVLNIYCLDAYCSRRRFFSRLRAAELEPLVHLRKLKVLLLHGFIRFFKEPAVKIHKRLPCSLEFLYLELFLQPDNDTSNVVSIDCSQVPSKLKFIILGLMDSRELYTCVHHYLDLSCEYTVFNCEHQRGKGEQGQRKMDWVKKFKGKRPCSII